MTWILIHQHINITTMIYIYYTVIAGKYDDKELFVIFEARQYGRVYLEIHHKKKGQISTCEQSAPNTNKLKKMNKWFHHQFEALFSILFPLYCTVRWISVDRIQDPRKVIPEHYTHTLAYVHIIITFVKTSLIR